MIGKVKHFIFSFIIITVGGVLLSLNNRVEENYTPYKVWDDLDPINTPVEDILVLLNDKKPIHYLEKVDLDSARMGEELVKYGQLKDNSNSRISKYFVCTDCHNQVLETDDPSDESPDRVLKYSKKNEIPFLPGSTFYGMYNKDQWYNGDYAKKYGDLVKPARDSLYNAIQLCATQCSQGREMEFWEIRCVVHYYKTLEFKISDLVLEPSELGQLSAWVVKENEKAVKLLKGKYNQINDAHFGTSEIPKIEGYEPKFENGEYIYKGGCLYCHAYGRGITNFDLGDDILSYKFLAAKKEKYNSYSISHITRYGTYAISGRKQYMPQYTYENMSDEQMLDLIYFVETKAKE